MGFVFFYLDDELEDELLDDELLDEESEESDDELEQLPLAMSHSLEEDDDDDDELELGLDELELELDGEFLSWAFLSFWNSFNIFFWASTEMLRRARVWVILFCSLRIRRSSFFSLFFWSRTCFNGCLLFLFLFFESSLLELDDELKWFNGYNLRC